MQEITSVNNDLVKETVKLQQKKYRDKENKFLLEGFKCISEAYEAGVDIEYAFVSDEKRYGFLGEKAIVTNEAVLKKVSTTDSPPDAVAVALKKTYSVNDLKNAKKVVLLENVKDLGNLGTILRTSTAFGAEALVLYGRECADIYNPKCVRSSVGNLWKIPVVYIESFDELQKYFAGFNCVATLPHASSYLKDFKAQLPLLVMFGSEADGLSDEMIGFSTDSVKIEMASSVESLNLSVSCAVVLYKLFL
ncbi:fIG011178: rRNA methylase [Clostridium sp. CAG:967]|nr:fIG011178: rRNA methylase [Clostridium sp. CAG:967]